METATKQKTKTDPFAGMSLSEIEAEVKRRKQEEQQQKVAERNRYEYQRDVLVKDLVAQAIELNQIMTDFKAHAICSLDKFQEIAQKYGDVKSNSKGGYGLRSRCGEFKVVYERNTKVEYDERANMGEKLIREFLTNMVKVRDKSAYNIIIGLLERGKDGDFNPASVAALIKREDEYTDERWNRGIKLFKESHNIVLIGMNVSFYVKNSMNKDEAIKLTFASIPVANENQDISEQLEAKG